MTRPEGIYYSHPVSAGTAHSIDRGDTYHPIEFCSVDTCGMDVGESRRASAPTVWVVDIKGYDARGGNAEVYASLEAAMAAVGTDAETAFHDEKEGWWYPADPYCTPGRDGKPYRPSPLEEQYGTSDHWVIYPAEVKG